MSSPHGGRIAVLASAVVFSTGGAAVKLATLDAWQIAGLRSAIAAVVLWAILPEARRRFSPRILLVGCAYAATLVLYVAANRLTTAANAIFLQSTAPLYVMALSPWLLGERVARRDLSRMVVILLGMALFFAGSESPSATAPAPEAGNLLAMLCGVSWALVILGLRRLSRTGRRDEGGDGTAACVAGNVLACVVCLPFAFPLEGVDAVDAGTLLYLGAIQVALAYVLLIRGSRSVTALDASLILLVDPVLNPVWAWLVHGETPGLAAIAGGILILGATVARIVERPATAAPRSGEPEARDR